MLKLKLQYFGHLMRRTDSFEKTLMLGKIEGGRRRGWQRMNDWMKSQTQWRWVWVSSGSWWWTGKPGVLRSVGSQRVGQDWGADWNWIGIELLCSAKIKKKKKAAFAVLLLPIRYNTLLLIIAEMLCSALLQSPFQDVFPSHLLTVYGSIIELLFIIPTQHALSFSGPSSQPLTPCPANYH